MAREQKGRGEAKEEEGGRRKEGTMTKPATTISMAEEATIASAGNNRICSDGGCGEDECGSGERSRARTECGDSSQTGSLCYGNR